MKDNLPEGVGKSFYAWACGTGSEMMLLTFDDLDACRDAFYCAIKNPKGVMESQNALLQDDPIASCEEKLLPAMIPFLADLDAGAPYLKPNSDAYNATCVQIPIGKYSSSSTYRKYMGCVRADDPEFPAPNDRKRDVIKYDPRASGIMNLNSRTAAGVAAACTLGSLLFIVLIALAVRPFVLEKMKARKGVPGTVKVGDV